MKLFVRPLCLAYIGLTLACAVSHGGTVRILWDPSPKEDRILEYRVYEVVGDAYVWRATTATNQATFYAPPGPHCYVATAVNAWQVSDYSETLCGNVSTNGLTLGDPNRDVVPPTSGLNPLPEQSYSIIPLSWFGSDNDAGVAAFDIFVSVNGGPFVLWLDDVTELQAEYVGEVGNSYAFMSVATDRAGNEQTLTHGDIVATRVSLINTAPQFLPQPVVEARIGEVAVVPIPVQDLDVPRQSLTFSLEGPVVPGMTIHPTSGYLHWIPTESYAGQTMTVQVGVRDNGFPVLGDLHEVTIHVPHFARLELGDSVAQEGLAGLIPVWIQSTANVEEFTFALSGLNDRITRLDMIGFGGTVCDRVVVKDGDTWVVWFKVCGQYPRLEYFLVGGLRFVTETGATGVFTVQVSDFAVFQSDNNLVGDLSTRGSKLTVFGDRPVLEIRRVSVEESALTIYASPGRNYVVLVQRSPLGAGPWEYFGEIWMEKSKYTFPPIPLDQSHVLFRAMVDPDSPP